MRTLLGLATLAAAALVLPGCPLATECDFDGETDTALRSESGDAFTLCGNGGFAAMLSDGTILEGRVFRVWNAETAMHDLQFADGENGNELFVATFQTSVGGYSAPALGLDLPIVTLDEVERDHAHVQCDDLELRTWW